MLDTDGLDETIIVMSLMIMVEELPMSRYPISVQRKIRKRALELIERIQARYR